jgi:hypothetical protein
MKGILVIILLLILLMMIQYIYYGEVIILFEVFVLVRGYTE